LFSWSTSETPSPSLATSAPTSYFALTRDQGETLEGRRLKSLISQQLNHLTYISSEPYVFNPNLTLPSRHPTSFSSSSSVPLGPVHSHPPPGPIPIFQSIQLVNDNPQQTIVFRTVSPGVIRRLLVQVIVPETGETALDWSQAELTMNFDGSETHQIDHISFRDFFRTGWGFVKVGAHSSLPYPFLSLSLPLSLARSRSLSFINRKECLTLTLLLYDRIAGNQRNDDWSEKRLKDQRRRGLGCFL
jgi:hypothetical protein